MNTISTLIPRQNCPNNPVHFKHYNTERNHQGIENQLIRPEILSREEDISSKKHLGGMLTYYYRQAA